MEENKEMEVQEKKEKKELKAWDYVTITVKKYTKMIRKIERLTVEKEAMKAEFDAKYSAKCTEYWRLRDERDNLAKQLEELKKVEP